MVVNLSSRLTGFLGITQKATPQQDTPPGAKNAPSTSASAPLLGLRSLALPRATAGPSRPPSSAVSPEVMAAFSQAVKQARRQGFVGPRGSARPEPNAPARSPLSAGPANGPETPLNQLTPSMALLMLKGALAGTDKMRSMRGPERDHIMKMLEANDLPGLEAVTSNGNPLRSYATGLKVGKQALERHGAEQFSPAVGQALRDLKAFYEANPALVALGDASAFSPEKPRTAQDVHQLSAAFAQGDALLAALKRAWEAGG